MQGFCIVVLAAAIVKEFVPAVASSGKTEQTNAMRKTAAAPGFTGSENRSKPGANDAKSPVGSKGENVSKGGNGSNDASFVPHKIYSVPGFARCFDDNNDLQLAAAIELGIPPIADRDEAEARKDELVFIGSNPYFVVEKAGSSIPYLVPRAAVLLQDIGAAFFDSLQVKGIPLHKPLVSSVLRTEEDVARLRRHNSNAVANSCHRYATTFDICYNRYATVAPPDTPRRAVSNDTLKWVLSEALLDLKSAGRCYVKYEKKQGCFHITAR